MGYSTEFQGRLEFTTDVTADQLAFLSMMFGKDCRDHPEWETADGLYHVDLRLCRDFRGVEWDGAEKTYSLEKIVNVVIHEARKRWPSFGLKGCLLAQGEDFGDRWKLLIGEDGLACKKRVAITGTVVECPHCEQKFELEA